MQFGVKNGMCVPLKVVREHRAKPQEDTLLAETEFEFCSLSRGLRFFKEKK